MTVVLICLLTIAQTVIQAFRRTLDHFNRQFSLRSLSTASRNLEQAAPRYDNVVQQVNAINLSQAPLPTLLKLDDEAARAQHWLSRSGSLENDAAHHAPMTLYSTLKRVLPESVVNWLYRPSSVNRFGQAKENAQAAYFERFQDMEGLSLISRIGHLGARHSLASR
jgi:hypothetical protein